MNTTVCPWWAGGALKGPFRRRFHSPDKLVRPHLSAGMTAADIGSGMGYFTLHIAELVGASGTVLAADIQPQMLSGMHKAAVRAGVDAQIQAHLCPRDKLGMERWNGMVDFLLLSMVLHEMPDREAYAEQFFDLLRPGGKCLFMEPVLHVPKREFLKEKAMFLEQGFFETEEVHVPFARAALFQK